MAKWSCSRSSSPTRSSTHSTCRELIASRSSSRAHTSLRPCPSSLRMRPPNACPVPLPLTSPIDSMKREERSSSLKPYIFHLHDECWTDNLHPPPILCGRFNYLFEKLILLMILICISYGSSPCRIECQSQVVDFVILQFIVWCIGVFIVKIHPFYIGERRGSNLLFYINGSFTPLKSYIRQHSCQGLNRDYHF